MNKNVSLAIEKAVSSIESKNIKEIKDNSPKKPDLFSLSGEAELFQNEKGITIKIDRSRDSNLTDFGRATLDDRYLGQSESYQDLFARVASTYADNNLHAQRLYNYISNLWFMPATPVLSNGGTERGLPISCFLNEANDSLKGITDLWEENQRDDVVKLFTQAVRTETNCGNRGYILIERIFRDALEKFHGRFHPQGASLVAWETVLTLVKKHFPKLWKMTSVVIAEKDWRTLEGEADTTEHAKEPTRLLLVFAILRNRNKDNLPTLSSFMAGRSVARGFSRSSQMVDIALRLVGDASELSKKRKKRKKPRMKKQTAMLQSQRYLTGSFDNWQLRHQMKSSGLDGNTFLN